MLTIDQYSSHFYRLSANGGNAAKEAPSAEFMVTSDVPPTPSASAGNASVPTTKSRDEWIKERQKWASTPLTDEERANLASKNKTLDIEANLDVQAERPEFRRHPNGDYLHNLLFGMVRVIGHGAKMDQIEALVQGDPLDFRIQREYEDLLAGIAMDDAAWSLKDLAYTDTKYPGTLAYAREAIFQRSSIERGKGIDIGRLMHRSGIIDNEQFAALGPLSMPENSAKLQAYAAKVDAEGAGIDVEAPEESENAEWPEPQNHKCPSPQDANRPAPENSIFLTEAEAQNFTSPDPKFKVYVVKSAENTHEKMNISAVVKEIWVDTRGNIQVPNGYLLEELQI